MGTTPTPDHITGRPRARPAFARPYHENDVNREMRCVRCGAPWREDAAPCCTDPSGFVRVVQRDGLTTVYSDDGEVIAAVRGTLQPMAPVNPLAPPDLEPFQVEIDLAPPPDRERDAGLDRGL